MNFLISRIKLFFILNKDTINMTITIVFYLGFNLSNLDILTICAPHTSKDVGLANCFKALQEALKNLDQQESSKRWITKTVQNTATGGLEGSIASATVIEDGQAYTVYLGRAANEEKTLGLIGTCTQSQLVTEGVNSKELGKKNKN
jgi:hypothetical protein